MSSSCSEEENHSSSEDEEEDLFDFVPVEGVNEATDKVPAVVLTAKSSEELTSSLFRCFLKKVDDFCETHDVNLEPLRTELRPTVRLFTDVLNEIDKCGSGGPEAGTDETVPKTNKNTSRRRKLIRHHLETSQVFNNAVIIKNMIEYIGLHGRDPLRFRLVNKEWNKVICSPSSAESKQLIAKCRCNGSSEVVCDLVDNIVDTSLDPPRCGIRAFRLGVHWRDHLAHLVSFQCVSVDFLELNKFLLFDSPKYLTTDEKTRARPQPRMTECPGSSLNTILTALTPQRFQSLKGLKINMEGSEHFNEANFDNLSVFTKARRIFERYNPEVSHHQLNSLTHFELGAGAFFREHWPFLDLVTSRLIKEVGRLSPQLTHLVLWNCRITADALGPPVTLPNLTTLQVQVTCQEEVNAVVDLLHRSKRPQLTKLFVVVKTPRLRDDDLLMDLVPVLDAVSRTVVHLQMKVAYDHYTSTPKLQFFQTRWPIMPRLKEFDVHIEVLDRYPDIILDEVMPSLVHFRLFADKIPSEVYRLDGRNVSSRVQNMTLSLKDEHMTRTTNVIPQLATRVAFVWWAWMWDLGCIPISMFRRDWDLPNLTFLTIAIQTAFLKHFNDLVKLAKNWTVLIKLNLTVVHEYHSGPQPSLDTILTGLNPKDIRYLTDASPELVTRLASLANERNDSLIQMQKLRHLILKLEGDWKELGMSDWSGYQGLALMTHLDILTLHTRSNDDMFSTPCMEFIKRALEPKTQIYVFHDV